MPKLRNGKTPIAMMVDWLGRKVKNHQPMKELQLDKISRESLPRMYQPETQMKNIPTTTVVMIGEENAPKLLCVQGEVSWVVEVREATTEELKMKRVALGA